MKTGKHRLLKYFKEDFDHHDQWGCVMEWFFTVAHLIHHKCGLHNVPAEWEYRPSPLDTEIDAEEFHLIKFWDLDKFECDDLIGFGNVLSRYTDKLKAAGKNY